MVVRVPSSSVSLVARYMAVLLLPPDCAATT